jgi:xylulokinase
MNTEHLLGIDIGTYESKGVITTPEGQIVATCTQAHELSIPQPGWAEHDAESDWWGDLCRLTRDLLAKTGVDPSSILAVGCSTIGPCLLPVDSNGNPLRRAILYGIDCRAADEIGTLNSSLGEDVVYEQCGNSLSAQAIGPKILWLKNHEPEVFDRARRFVTGTTYLVWKLTGQWCVDPYSASTFVPLYDFRNRDWSLDLAKGIVDLERLAEITDTTAVVGKITREAAEETGLSAGTPVIAGTIDAAAEAVSVGVVEPGRMMLMYGSTAFMIQVVESPLTDRRVWAAPFLFPGTSSLMAGMATTGSLTRWFRDTLARDLLQAERKGLQNAYERLASEAAEVSPGSDGLVLLPYFSGERTPINDPQAKGVFFGLTLNHSRGQIYRAILESVALGIRHHLEVFDEIEASVSVIRAVGGGTKNRLWLQIVSDTCGVAQEIPEVTIGASYGDAFLAGLGIGAFSSQGEIAQWVKLADTVGPNASTAEKYDLKYRLYRELYRRTRDLMPLT